MWVVSQVNYGADAWFTRQDVCNAGEVRRDRELDCADLVTGCIAAKEADDRFQFKVLTYVDYCQLQGAKGYGHKENDLMAIMWMEPRQLAMALAKAYTTSWDASHKTNWLGFKYFDFTVLGDFNMLELISQGLQRHEDNPTSIWIVQTLREFCGAGCKLALCFIDGAPECKYALDTTAWLISLRDEWHDNKNYLVELSGTLGDGLHAFLAKLYTLKYDDDLRTVAMIPVLLSELIEEAGLELSWPSRKGLPSAINPKDGLTYTGGAKLVNAMVESWQKWARCVS
jgi:hypothetical protein